MCFRSLILIFFGDSTLDAADEVGGDVLTIDDLSETKLGTDSAMDLELGSSFGSGGSSCVPKCDALSRCWPDCEDIALSWCGAAVEERDVELDVVVGRECER